jgi:hypothetical protein
MRFTEFFEETPGRMSSTRLCMILWNLTVTAVWAYLTIQSKAITQIADVITITAIMNGLKLFQKGQEIKNGNGKAVEKPNP